jgi:thioesterase domain-containing protein
LATIPLVRRLLVKYLPTPATLRLRLINGFWAAYDCPPFDGVIHLIKSAKPGYPIRTPLPPPPDLAWRSLALGGLIVHEVPGGHLEMVKDPIAAATAKAVIDSIGADSS